MYNTPYMHLLQSWLVIQWVTCVQQDIFIAMYMINRTAYCVSYWFGVMMSASGKSLSLYIGNKSLGDWRYCGKNHWFYDVLSNPHTCKMCVCFADWIAIPTNIKMLRCLVQTLKKGQLTSVEYTRNNFIFPVSYIVAIIFIEQLDMQTGPYTLPIFHDLPWLGHTSTLSPCS